MRRLVRKPSLEADRDDTDETGWQQQKWRKIDPSNIHDTNSTRLGGCRRRGRRRRCRAQLLGVWFASGRRVVYLLRQGSAQ